MEEEWKRWNKTKWDRLSDWQIDKGKLDSRGKEVEWEAKGRWEGWDKNHTLNLLSFTNTDVYSE